MRRPNWKKNGAMLLERKTDMKSLRLAKSEQSQKFSSHGICQATGVLVLVEMVERLSIGLFARHSTGRLQLPKWLSPTEMGRGITTILKTSDGRHIRKIFPILSVMGRAAFLSMPMLEKAKGTECVALRMKLSRALERSAQTVRQGNQWLMNMAFPETISGEFCAENLGSFARNGTKGLR